MAFYTIVSLSDDGVRRSTTVEAKSEDEAKKIAERMNLDIADQEQTKAYEVSEVTKE